MGFISNFLKKGTINITTLRVLRELGESLQAYRKKNPGEPLKNILSDNRFHKTLKVRSLSGTVQKSAENLIPPCPQDLLIQYPDKKTFCMILHIVTNIVLYELSYDSTIGSDTDIRIIVDAVLNNFDKLVSI